MNEETRQEVKCNIILGRALGAMFGVLFLWLIAQIPNLLLSIGEEKWLYTVQTEFWVILCCFATVTLWQSIVEARIWSEEGYGERLLRWATTQKENTAKYFLAAGVILVIAPTYLVLYMYKDKNEIR